VGVDADPSCLTVWLRVEEWYREWTPWPGRSSTSLISRTGRYEHEGVGDPLVLRSRWEG